MEQAVANLNTKFLFLSSNHCTGLITFNGCFEILNIPGLSQVQLLANTLSISFFLGNP